MTEKFTQAVLYQTKWIKRSPFWSKRINSTNFMVNGENTLKNSRRTTKLIGLKTATLFALSKLVHYPRQNAFDSLTLSRKQSSSNQVRQGRSEGRVML